MPKLLSVRAIENARKSAAGREIMVTDTKIPSLFVRVHSSGVASYVFRHREKGRVYKATLGRVKGLSLADARKTASAYLGRIALGFDPIAEKAEKIERHNAALEEKRRARVEAATAGVFTVGAMIRFWAAARENDARSVRYVANFRSALERTFESVLALPARDLDRTRIEKLIEAAARRGPAAAAQAQMALSIAFKRAIKAGKLEINPCSALESPKTRQRARFLVELEIQRVWRAAGTLPSPFGNFVRFLMATGARRNEALEARWDEIEDDRWILPAARMKGGRDFTVPLTRAAFRALPPCHDRAFIFSAVGSERPIGGLSRFKTALDSAIKADGEGPPLAPWTFHDLRRPP
jgi:integrase